ncbi:GTPase-GDP dissociation stimulator vimar [Anabrus simplex]|uniref:GTPase-GDP dissociation stimulator vimar n=1 Tax=Anabrus simplex TaxID=316456 RepID=UPI0035A336C2
MDVPSDKDCLPQLMEGLAIAVEKKSEDVSSLLDSIVLQVQDSNNACVDYSSFVDHLQALLCWESKTIISKSAKVISELAKADAGREKCATSSLLKLLVKFMKDEEQDIQVLIQVCRALGNICYENDKGRLLILDADCLPILLQVLKRSLSETGESGRSLRNVAAGFLLNLLIGHEDIQQKAVELGVVDILCRVLELDGIDAAGEESCTHALVILELITDSAVNGNESLLDEQMCKVAVQVLGASSSPEVSEMCLELLHGQAENEQVKIHLARAGLCELLIQLLEKHKPLVEDDEARNLMKMACDLIVLVLTGDDSMNILYSEGQGQVFHSMVSWLSSDDEDLQITGVLAMGNFARTDKHCIQMVEAGVSKKLLTLVERNNTPDGDIRLQHALLSALRNLVIPSQNKATVLNDGLMNAVAPMLAIPTFPVVFKLLGTLRMVVDGQEEAARELGQQHELVQRLVQWCGTEDHPGVQGEANRLLAWLIKNSHDQGVLNVMLETGAVPCLVTMVTAEHAVMQNEALMALALIAAMRLNDASESLVAAKIGSSITKLLTDFGPSLSQEVVQNALTLLEQLCTSDIVKSHLIESHITSALKPISSQKNNSDMSDQINRLVSMLDSG